MSAPVHIFFGEFRSSLQTATDLLPMGCRVSASLTFWVWVVSMCTRSWAAEVMAFIDARSTGLHGADVLQADE